MKSEICKYTLMGGIQRCPVFAGPVPTVVAL